MSPTDPDGRVRIAAFEQLGAPSPGPVKAPEDQMRGVLGMREVRYVRTGSPLVVVDSTLAG